MRHHISRDLRQHYVEAGRGDVVVLLHGWPQTWYCWRDLIPHLDGFRIIAPDLRGLGDSADPQQGYTKRAIASDINDLIEELQIDRYHLVGHDWGGVVAWSLAAHFPARVRTLAIVDVAIPGDGEADISQGGRRWHHRFHQTADLPEALVVGRESDYLGWFYDHYGATADAISESARTEYLRTYRDPRRLHTGFEYYRALPQDASDNAAIAARQRPAMPCLAVGGRESFGRGQEVEVSLRKMAEDVRGAVVDGAGHWVPEEQPEVLAQLLREHFARA